MTLIISFFPKYLVCINENMVCQGCKWTHREFCRMLDKEDDLIPFLQQHGVLEEDVICPKCDKPCRLYYNDSYRFKCVSTKVVLKSRKKVRVSCHFSVSIRNGTLFNKAHLSIETVCGFISEWLYIQAPKHQKLEHELGLSSHAVVRWSSFCREVCFVAIMDGSVQLGGGGNTVELYEAKMSERKLNTRRTIEGQWVFGGFERETKQCFLATVEEPDKESLLEVIRKWVLPDTVIISECWKAYDCLSNEAFLQESVKRSIKFLDLKDGRHLKNIDEVTSDVSQNTPKFNPFKSHAECYLAEFLFQKKYPDHRDQLHNFFRSVSLVKPPSDVSDDE